MAQSHRHLIKSVVAKLSRCRWGSKVRLRHRLKRVNGVAEMGSEVPVFVTWLPFFQLISLQIICENLVRQHRRVKLEHFSSMGYARLGKSRHEHIEVSHKGWMTISHKAFSCIASQHRFALSKH